MSAAERKADAGARDPAASLRLKENLCERSYTASGKALSTTTRKGGRAAPLDLPLDKIETFNPGNPVDAVVCNFGFLVFDPNVSLAGVLLRYYALARENSCGACTPCRTGSILLAECLATRWKAGAIRLTGTICSTPPSR